MRTVNTIKIYNHFGRFLSYSYSRDSHILLCFIGISLVRDTACNEAWVDNIIYYCRVSCIKNDMEGCQYQVLFGVHNFLFFCQKEKGSREPDMASRRANLILMRE